MVTAFVLSGGGSLGAVQVGMLHALAEREVRPDLLVGTSAGALNAGFIAGNGFDPATIRRLGDIWRSLRRRDVFPVGPGRALRTMLGMSPAIASGAGLVRLVGEHLHYRNLEDMPIGLHVVATDVLSGREVLLSEGDAQSAIVASASVPGLLPPVERDGRLLIDGGITNNTAISHAVTLGADRIVVLPTGYSCALDTPPGTALAAGLHALTLLIERRLIRDVAEAPAELDLMVLPPLCPLDVSAADFSQADILIDRARQAAGDWIDTGNIRLPHQERFLSLHGHQRIRSTPAPIEQHTLPIEDRIGCTHDEVTVT